MYNNIKISKFDKSLSKLMFNGMNIEVLVFVNRL